VIPQFVLVVFSHGSSKYEMMQDEPLTKGDLALLLTFLEERDKNHHATSSKVPGSRQGSAPAAPAQKHPEHRTGDVIQAQARNPALFLFILLTLCLRRTSAAMP
jgi:hypothetical protein